MHNKLSLLEFCGSSISTAIASSPVTSLSNYICKIVHEKPALLTLQSLLSRKSFNTIVTSSAYTVLHTKRLEVDFFLLFHYVYRLVNSMIVNYSTRLHGRHFIREAALLLNLCSRRIINGSLPFRAQATIITSAKGMGLSAHGFHWSAVGKVFCLSVMHFLSQRGDGMSTSPKWVVALHDRFVIRTLF